MKTTENISDTICYEPVCGLVAGTAENRPTLGNRCKCDCSCLSASETDGKDKKNKKPGKRNGCIGKW